MLRLVCAQIAVTSERLRLNVSERFHCPVRSVESAPSGAGSLLDVLRIAGLLKGL